MSQGTEAPQCVVVGGYVADCIVNTPRLPVWGETYEARSVRTSRGGKALNQAVALARLGGRVTAVGAVGDDPLGLDILATLTRERVDASGLQVRQGIPTPICVCLVGDDGRTSFVWHIAEDATVTPEALQASAQAIERADVVLVTFEVPLPTVRATIEIAQRHGAEVVVQAAPPLRTPADAKSLPWDAVDLLVPNETEARALLSAWGEHATEPHKVAEVLAEKLSVPWVVVTLAENGCIAYSRMNGSRHYPAHQAEQVADTTGGSDAFTAALALRLITGEPESEAIHAALCGAAEAISQPGGYESMPTR